MSNSIWILSKAFRNLRYETFFRTNSVLPNDVLYYRHFRGLIRKPSRRWENNIKIDLYEIIRAASNGWT
jgi:hypothetical protein